LGIGAAAGSALSSSSEAIKAKTFEVLRRLSTRGGRRRPLILVLEDLQWVDKISEEFLGILAEDAPDAPIFLLAAHRSGYQPPGLDRSYVRQIPLSALTGEDSLRVVRSMVRAVQLVELVTEKIVAKADGNPLFLGQLAPMRARREAFDRC
jgi:predicted ATPase